MKKRKEQQEKEIEEERAKITALQLNKKEERIIDDEYVDDVEYLITHGYIWNKYSGIWTRK
jgi:hypothetical protein